MIISVLVSEQAGKDRTVACGSMGRYSALATMPDL